MSLGRNLGWAGLPNFSKKSISHTQTILNWVIFYLQQLTLGCFFLHFEPFWSNLDNTMAIELRLVKPIVDYQKLILFSVVAIIAWL